MRNVMVPFGIVSFVTKCCNSSQKWQAFELWIKSPMPMVTLTKTFDVTRLCRVSHRHGRKFNMLLCWCIGKTASRMEEFYLLPEQGKLYEYDRPISTI